MEALGHRGPPGEWGAVRGVDRLDGMRIPSLGPRGEGWTFIQVTLMVALTVAGVAGPAWPGDASWLRRGVGLLIVDRRPGPVHPRPGRARSLADSVPETLGTRTAAGGRRLPVRAAPDLRRVDPHRRRVVSPFLTACAGADRCSRTRARNEVTARGVHARAALPRVRRIPASGPMAVRSRRPLRTGVGWVAETTSEGMP